MSWKPIVVGVDGSPEAAGAAVFALNMSRRAGTTCHSVHATRDAIVALPGAEVTRYRQALVDQAWTRIEQALRGNVPGTLLDRVIVRLGPTAVVLKHVVASLDAELVVLGGKHHSTLGRWFGGSTSLNAARTTEVPLLVTAGPATSIRRVLVAVDLSGAASPTLAAAERYAALFGAELRVLSVIEPIPVIAEISPPYDFTEYYRLSEEQLRQEIWPLIRSPHAEKVLRHGTAVETISQEVTEWRADLLVVGSHGKGWAQRLLLGSVTERMLNQLPTSLLVIPAPAAVAIEPAAREAERPQSVVAIA